MISSNVDGNGYQTIPPEADSFPLRLRTYTGAAKYKIHWHRHTELLYFLKGGASVYSGGDEILTQDGDLVIANQNELHRGDFRETGVYYYCIQLPPDFFSWSDRGTFYLFPHLIRGDAEIGRLFGEIYRVWQGRQEGYRYATLAGAYALMTYLIGHYRTETLSDRTFTALTAKLERFNAVIDAVNARDAALMTTREAAAMAHLSETYFCHTFRERFGVSFLAYQNSVRMRQATALLHNTLLSVKEVAARVGFSDVNYFSRLYKRTTGQSPREVRRDG